MSCHSQAGLLYRFGASLIEEKNFASYVVLFQSQFYLVILLPRHRQTDIMFFEVEDTSERFFAITLAKVFHVQMDGAPVLRYVIFLRHYWIYYKVNDSFYKWYSFEAKTFKLMLKHGLQKLLPTIYENFKHFLPVTYNIHRLLNV